MHYFLTSDHKHFFSQHHYIEFEDLFSIEEADFLRSKSDEILAKRLGKPVNQLESVSSKDLFFHGRDLFLQDEEIKKMVSRRFFGEIGSQLFKEHFLRLACDQYIHAGKLPHDPFLQPSLSLQQLSCFQTVSGGLLLRLSDGGSFSSERVPLPQKKGSGTFVSPILKLNLPALFSLPNASFFLLTYGPEKTIYTFSKTDPHTHALKRHGYVFGDTLRNTTHPLVYHSS